ncbi:uncharacterized protein LOC124160926 [Ischnura elegans]|uniref:uncharacterized protein LOC124160926 n=1 Tax=Ischnura elegans TaxID=197161 RepID=UPI001ED8B1AD|nr:uncharacterized protein LOC124160926 [Ischnura elegans]
MVSTVQGVRIRNFFGLVLAFLGSFSILFALSLGISGLVMYFSQGDLFWIGNPVTGPSVSFFLILEGFLLELALALSLLLFGYSVKGNLRASLILLRKAKTKLAGKGIEHFQEGIEEEEFDSNKEISWPKLDKFRKDFETKAPKCLWISLLLMSGVNLGIALTCRIMASEDAPSGLGMAMRSYGTDPKARKALDYVQQKGECCGDQVYTDWLNVQWCMERASLVPSEVGMPGYVNVCGPKHRDVKNDVPGSCCTPRRSPCIHDPLDLFGLGLLHTDGCSRYIENQLKPKYMSMAKFHLFLGIYKLILMALVFLLRPRDDPQSETATDDEAKGLLDDLNPKNFGLSELVSKPSTKSWFSGLAKKVNPKASDEQSPTEESKPSDMEDKSSSRKQIDSNKLISSAIKFTDPVKKLPKIISKEANKAPEGAATDKMEVKEKESVGIQAAPIKASSSRAPVLSKMDIPEEKNIKLDQSSPSRSAQPVSDDIRKRGIDEKSSRLSRTRSYDSKQVSPRPNVKGSLSQWSKPLSGNKPDSVVAQITPSSNEQRKISPIGVVN